MFLVVFQQTSNGYGTGNALVDHPGSPDFQTTVSLFVYSTRFSVFKTTHQTLTFQVRMTVFYVWQAVELGLANLPLFFSQILITDSPTICILKRCV